MSNDLKYFSPSNELYLPVLRGMAYLDQHYPGWVDKADTGELDMTKSCKDIRSQVGATEIFDGNKELGMHADWPLNESKGGPLTQTWIEAIETRRRLPTIPENHIGAGHMNNEQYTGHKINDDFVFDGEGNLQVRGEHTVSRGDLENFFDWLHQAPIINGEQFSVNGFSFGCQNFNWTQLKAVRLAFEEKRWKQPVEKEYTIGDRFTHGDREYMYCNVGIGQYNLIDIDSGTRMFSRNIEKDSRYITLEELNSHSIFPNIKSKE